MGEDEFNEEHLRQLEKIVLYHGSLRELNERRFPERYRFSDKLNFMAEEHGVNGGLIDELLLEAKEELKLIGYDGLVNARTSVSYREEDSAWSLLLEGTPIILIRSSDR